MWPVCFCSCFRSWPIQMSCCPTSDPRTSQTTIMTTCCPCLRTTEHTLAHKYTRTPPEFNRRLSCKIQTLHRTEQTIRRKQKNTTFKYENPLMCDYELDSNFILLFWFFCLFVFFSCISMLHPSFPVSTDSLAAHRQQLFKVTTLLLSHVLATNCIQHHCCS